MTTKGKTDNGGETETQPLILARRQQRRASTAIWVYGPVDCVIVIHTQC